MALTRRLFIAAGAGPLLAVFPGVLYGRAQGLDRFGTAGPACNDTGKTTPAVPRDATFRPGSPERASFVEAGAAGLVLTGTVSGVTCGRIKGARVDFWHADAAGAYGDRFRGYQLTDATGGYRLTTIVPGASGNRARHIGVNVKVAGKADYWTEIFFPDDPAQARDVRFRKELLIRLVPGADPRRQTGTFDFVLDL